MFETDLTSASILLLLRMTKLTTHHHFNDNSNATRVLLAPQKISSKVHMHYIELKPSLVMRNDIIYEIGPFQLIKGHGFALSRILCAKIDSYELLSTYMWGCE